MYTYKILVKNGSIKKERKEDLILECITQLVNIAAILYNYSFRRI
jgi:hypothetical protein